MRQDVLRRRSWPILCGIVIVGLGVGMLAAVCKVTSVNGFRTGWQGMPIYLALAGICGRIANCKVILLEDALVVVNPLRSHILPNVAIRDVSVSDDGTLEVHLKKTEPSRFLHLVDLWWIALKVPAKRRSERLVRGCIPPVR